MPANPVPPGSRITLECRSAGTSDLVTLVWYIEGRQVDTSYYVTDDFVVNEYEIVADADVEDINPVCQLDFPPMNLRMSESATIKIIGLDHSFDTFHATLSFTLTYCF